MIIDLHSHSDASDGLDSPSEVVRRATAAGVDVLALTDHDTVAGQAEAATAASLAESADPEPPDGSRGDRDAPVLPRLAPGCEMSCLAGGESVHLLAYLFDPAEPALAAELQRLREDRVRRARGMVDRLAALGAEVSWARVRELAAGEAIGRPHVARAMVEAGVAPDLESAFGADWLAPGGRAHVAKHAPDPAHAIGLVRAAGGVTVLAHPYARQAQWDGPDELIARLAAAGLTGLEVDHPGHDAEARVRLRDLAAELGLVATGGSDNHGSGIVPELGGESTLPGEYERLVAAARDAAAVVR